MTEQTNSIEQYQAAFAASGSQGSPLRLPN
jgi:hypothetical protein